jgi:hypothetical protein
MLRGAERVRSPHHHQSAGRIRGLDAMHFAAADGTLFALIGADGAAPYRISLTTAAHYDTGRGAESLVHKHCAVLARMTRKGVPRGRDTAESVQTMANTKKATEHTETGRNPGEVTVPQRDLKRRTSNERADRTDHVVG